MSKGDRFHQERQKGEGAEAHPPLSLPRGVYQIDMVFLQLIEHLVSNILYRNRSTLYVYG